MDFSLGQIGEIKPFSPYGLATGHLQLHAAINIANGIKWEYRGKEYEIPKVIHYGPQADWIPMTWQPEPTIVYPGRQNPIYSGFIAITLKNVNGVLY
jgi:hypothetical protein